jgi:hypothetical protein
VAFGISGCGVGDDVGPDVDVGLTVGMTLEVAVGVAIGSGYGVIVGTGLAALAFWTTSIVLADMAINSIRAVPTINITCLYILPPRPRRA